METPCSVSAMDIFALEKKPCLKAERALAGQSDGLVAGLDEAGRGPWAGPVVAAAVIFKCQRIPAGLNDSKRLSASARTALFDAIHEMAWVGVGIVGVGDIDRLNILQASLRAMAEAAAMLPTPPSVALVDGNRRPDLPQRTVTVVKGDSLCPSIAAASIIAKVTRDRLMDRLSEDFPAYGWDSNKGYGTRAHAESLSKFGVTPHHRRSFAPVRVALNKAAAEKNITI